MRYKLPGNWEHIASLYKESVGWLCEGCGAPHGCIPNMLTVHHIDGDPSHCDPQNMVALCQRCHLRVRSKGYLGLDKAQLLKKLREMLAISRGQATFLKQLGL